MQKTKRIYIGGDELSEEQALGLFWVKEGRAYCFEGSCVSPLAAKVYRLIQEYYPLVEVGMLRTVSCLENAEECLQVEEKGVIAVRQVGEVKIGNVHLLIKKIEEVLA